MSTRLDTLVVYSNTSSDLLAYRCWTRKKLNIKELKSLTHDSNTFCHSEDQIKLVAQVNKGTFSAQCVQIILAYVHNAIITCFCDSKPISKNFAEAISNDLLKLTSILEIMFNKVGTCVVPCSNVPCALIRPRASIITSLLDKLMQLLPDEKLNNYISLGSDSSVGPKTGGIMNAGSDVWHRSDRLVTTEQAMLSFISGIDQTESCYVTITEVLTGLSYLSNFNQLTSVFIYINTGIKLLSNISNCNTLTCDLELNAQLDSADLVFNPCCFVKHESSKLLKLRFNPSFGPMDFMNSKILAPTQIQLPFSINIQNNQLNESSYRHYKLSIGLLSGAVFSNRYSTDSFKPTELELTIIARETINEPYYTAGFAHIVDKKLIWSLNALDDTMSTLEFQSYAAGFQLFLSCFAKRFSILGISMKNLESENSESNFNKGLKHLLQIQNFEIRYAS